MAVAIINGVFPRALQSTENRKKQSWAVKWRVFYLTPCTSWSKHRKSVMCPWWSGGDHLPDTWMCHINWIYALPEMTGALVYSLNAWNCIYIFPWGFLPSHTLAREMDAESMAEDQTWLLGRFGYDQVITFLMLAYTLHASPKRRCRALVTQSQ